MEDVTIIVVDLTQEVTVKVDESGSLRSKVVDLENEANFNQLILDYVVRANRDKGYVEDYNYLVSKIRENLDNGTYSDAKLLLIPSGVKVGKLHSQKPTDGTGDFTVKNNDIDVLPTIVNNVLEVGTYVITVTPPLGVTEIIETIDGVDQTPITVIPATYQIPNYKLGSELVINGGFDTDLSSWNNDVSRGTKIYDNGRCKLINDGVNGYPSIFQTLIFEEGKNYRVKCNVDIGTATLVRVHIYDDVNFSNYNQELTSSGEISFNYVGSSDVSGVLNLYIFEAGNTGNYAYFDNVSVIEVLPIESGINKIVMK